MRFQYRTRAHDDIAEIYRYRSEEHSPQVAAYVAAAIRAAVEMLAAHPEFGSKTDHRVGVRRWPMTEYPYTIFYVIHSQIETIDIVRVLANARVRAGRYDSGGRPRASAVPSRRAQGGATGAAKGDCTDRTDEVGRRFGDEAGRGRLRRPRRGEGEYSGKCSTKIRWTSGSGTWRRQS
jgi:plasmid stabilization system protein ParE